MRTRLLGRAHTGGTILGHPDGTERRHQQRLIPDLGGAMGALNHLHGAGRRPTIAARHHMRGDPLGGEMHHQGDGRRRFARAARVDIADTDHRHIGAKTVRPFAYPPRRLRRIKRPKRGQ